MAELWLPSVDNKSTLSLIGSYSDNKIATQFHLENKSLFSIDFDKGLAGKVWKSSTTILMNNIDTDPEFIRNQSAAKAGLKSAIGIPLFQNQEVVAILLLATERKVNSLTKYQHILDGVKQNLGIEIKRKKLEFELTKIFNTAPDIICIIGKDGRFKKLNCSAERILEYREEELVNKELIDFVHPNDKERTLTQFDRLSKGEKVVSFENRYISKTGTVKWLSWSASPPSNGEQLIYAIGKDTTQENELRELLSEAVNLARIGSWSVDLNKEENPVIYCSPISCDIFETTHSFQPTLKDGFGIYQEEHQAQMKEALNQLVYKQVPYDLEIPIITKKGNIRWVRCMAKGEYIEDKCVRIFGSFQDIHEQKVAKIDLLKAFRDKNTILDSIRDAFFAVDKEYTVTYWNREAERVLGVKKKQIIGKKVWEAYENSTQLHFYSQYYRAMESGETLHFEEYNPSLNKWFEVSAYPSSKGLSVYFRDVTERKVSQELIRQSNERFEKVTEATQDAIWDWDITEDKLYWGVGYTRLFGYSTKKDNIKLATWKKLVHDEDVERISQSLEETLNNPTRTSWQEEYRFKKKNGTYAYVFDQGVIIRDKDGMAVRLVGAMSDFTQRIEYEKSLKELNATLELRAKELADSNNELEQFAYIASHDMQEPLRMVSSFLAQLEKKYSANLDEKALKYIEFAVDGAKRMRQIILDLLEFSRVGKFQNPVEEVSIQEVVSEVCHLQQQLIKRKQASIEFDHLPKIIAHRSPILQVFHNLIGNAIKYNKNGVKPKVEITAKSSGECWQFSVKDNGIGIDQVYFEKIFIIFQRLHRNDDFEGTGLGLAIVKKIVDRLGGNIWIESTLGEGSTFHFTIPKQITENH